VKRIKTDNLAVIVSDSFLKKTYGQKIERSLKAAGFKFTWFLVSSGGEKSLSEVERLYHHFVKYKSSRRSAVISLGGGLVQDLSCYASATYKRGLKLVQIPTTLLIQADTNLGGCAVDLPEGKSLVGAFYQPSLVIQDVELLQNLPEVIYQDGLAEIIKYAINADFFDQLEKDFDKLLKKNLSTVEKYVYLSNKIKLNLTERDEHDCRDIRIQIDLGHTFSHALETVTGYRLSHGQALAIGLRAAVIMSQKRGLLSVSKRERIEKLLSATNLPMSVPKTVRFASLMSHIKTDKKCYDNKLVFVLIKDFGRLIVVDNVTVNEVKNVLNQLK